MKVCAKCKTKAQDSMSFCAQCGGNVFEPAKKVSAAAKVLSVFLSIILVLALVVGGLLLTVRTTFSENTVDVVVETMTDELADMEIGQLVDAKDEDMTVAEYVHSLLPSAQKADVSVKDIEALLEEDFVVDFLDETARNYLSDAIYNNGDGELNIDDIVEMIEENTDVITEHTGYYLHEEDMRYIEDILEDAELEKYELKSIAKDNSGYFSLLRLTNSTVLFVVVLLVVLLLLLLIFLICKNAGYSFKCTAVDMIVAGGLLGIAAVCVALCKGMIRDVLEAAADITDKFFETMLRCTLLETAVLIGAGVVILLVLFVVKKLTKEKC